MYVLDLLRTLWESNVVIYMTATLGWMATWVGLKAVMLNLLGTLSERRKLAYDAIKKIRQESGRSPTDLFDYMRPLWEELGLTIPPEL
jgi:hypothetical protein